MGGIEYQEQNPIIVYHVAKYGSLGFYDEDIEKIFIIAHEELQFEKNDFRNLIWITNERNGSMSDHKYFFINEDIFDIIQTTNQGKNMLLKIISNEPNKYDYQFDAA